MNKFLLLLTLLMGCVPLTLGQVHQSMRTPYAQAPAQQVGPESMPPPIQAVQEFLGLTTDQVKRWEELQQARKEKMATLRDDIKALEEQLQEQWKLTNPTPATVGDLAIKLHNARREANELPISFAVPIRALLTPEQTKKLETVEECFQLQKITGALFATGFLAPPPPPPRPPAPPAPPAPPLP